MNFRFAAAQNFLAGAVRPQRSGLSGCGHDIFHFALIREFNTYRWQLGLVYVCVFVCVWARTRHSGSGGHPAETTLRRNVSRQILDGKSASGTLVWKTPGQP